MDDCGQLRELRRFARMRRDIGLQWLSYSNNNLNLFCDIIFITVYKINSVKIKLGILFWNRLETIEPVTLNSIASWTTSQVDGTVDG